MITDIKGKVRQETVELGGEGDQDNVRMNKLGALFTADWKYQLAAAGFVWVTHAGTLTAGADVALVVGGGNGTTVDSDQPELILGVGAGYYLVPMEIDVNCDIDCDADNEYGEIVVFADRTQAPPSTNASGTALTPINVLDGASAGFPGVAWSASTGDITDPVLSDLIAFRYFSTADNGTAASALAQQLSYSKEFTYPKIYQGPCSLVVCWGGTAAVNGLVTVAFAIVPTNHFS